MSISLTHRDTIRAVGDAIVDAIHAAGTDGIPSGHLYAMLMDKMSLGIYNALIDALVAVKRVRRTSSHLLMATCTVCHGPKIDDTSCGGCRRLVCNTCRHIDNGECYRCAPPYRATGDWARYERIDANGRPLALPISSIDAKRSLMAQGMDADTADGCMARARDMALK
jgi:hypothetical protein